MSQVTDRLATWMHERTRIDAVVAQVRARTASDTWSGMLWQICVYSFVVVSLTGLFLLFFYNPSTARVVYDGSYAPLRGVEISQALESTLNLSLDVRGGLLVRQLHNWASSLMIASLMVHILSVYFTGAFRKPREVVWVALFLVLFASMAAGLTGSVLPDDLLSSNTLAVLNGVTKALPVVGTWLAFVLFQGQFPNGAITTFYPLHVVILPLAIAALVVVIVGLSVAHRPASVPRSGSRPLVAGATRGAGLFFLVGGVLVAIAATVAVNPVSTYGPADPGNASAGAGAVWYLAFLDGAQRLVPSGWEFVWLERTWTLAVLVPVAVCGLYLLAAIAYPFLEGWVVGRRTGLTLDRPRNMPTRTGIGVAGVLFYGVLWAAAGSDVIALQFRLGAESVILALQVALVLGPPLAVVITKRICLGLQRRDRDVAAHGFETGRIVRLPGGEYVEVHHPVGEAERLRLVGHESPEPFIARPDRDGRIHLRDKARAIVSRWMFGDRLPSVGSAMTIEQKEASGT